MSPSSVSHRPSVPSYCTAFVVGFVLALVAAATGCTAEQGAAGWAAIGKILQAVDVGCAGVSAARPAVDAIRDLSGHKIPTVGEGASALSSGSP
jgi:hypothetical protein